MSKIPSNWRAVRYEQRLDSSGFSWMVVGDADDEAGEPKTIVLGDWLIEDVARLIASAPALVEALEEVLADLREQRDTGLCSRSRDEQIARIRAALSLAKGTQTQGETT